MSVLSREQIQRQDFVDNAIYDLIRLLTPEGHGPDWDIEMIGGIRDSISYWIVERKNVCNEMRFYPYFVD